MAVVGAGLTVVASNDGKRQEAGITVVANNDGMAEGSAIKICIQWISERCKRKPGHIIYVNDTKEMS